MQKRFRFGIAQKISLLTIALVLITALLMSRLILRQGRQILLDHEIVDHDDDTHFIGREVLADIQALREDARAWPVIRRSSDFCATDRERGATTPAPGTPASAGSFPGRQPRLSSGPSPGADRIGRGLGCGRATGAASNPARNHRPGAF